MNEFIEECIGLVLETRRSGTALSQLAFDPVISPDATKRRNQMRDRMILVVLVFSTVLGLRIAAPHRAAARDLDGRFSNSPLKGWFDSLRSDKGPCCSDADGTVLSDVDWESKDGHYRVRIQGQWLDVPDDAVIKEPNRAGRTMVWPNYVSPNGGPVRIDIRCFMPGSMT
jgi:hypothetical protein